MEVALLETVVEFGVMTVLVNVSVIALSPLADAWASAVPEDPPLSPNEKEVESAPPGRENAVTLAMQNVPNWMNPTSQSASAVAVPGVGLSSISFRFVPSATDSAAPQSGDCLLAHRRIIPVLILTQTGGCLVSRSQHAHTAPIHCDMYTLLSSHSTALFCYWVKRHGEVRNRRH